MHACFNGSNVRAIARREMSGSVGKRLQSAHTYDALVMLAATSDNPEMLEHLSQIDKDLLRTFPGPQTPRYLIFGRGDIILLWISC